MWKAVVLRPEKEKALPSDTQAEQSSPRPGDPEGRVVDAESVRQGRIVLGTPWRKTIFIAGLIGGLVIALLVGFLY